MSISEIRKLNENDNAENLDKNFILNPDNGFEKCIYL